MTASGRLYTWGFGESGQLANGGGASPDENVPYEVPAATGALAGTRGVVCVGVGGQHMVVVAAGGAGGAVAKAAASAAGAIVEDPPKDEDDDDEGGGGEGGDDADEEPEDDMDQ